jgi:hypothetical protein
MERKSKMGICLAATAVIWGFATGMLALCIPLVRMTGTPMLPLGVVVGATISTVMVWLNSDRQPRNSSELTSSASNLEQRIGNLEMIVSTQELDLNNKIKQLESKDK